MDIVWHDLVYSVVTMAVTKKRRKRNSDKSGDNNNNKISKTNKKNISVQSQAQQVIKSLQKIIKIQKKTTIQDY